MTKFDWFILTAFLLVFLTCGIILPTYFTIIVAQLNGLISWQAFAMIVMNALASYLTIDFLVRKWNGE